jgi:OmpA-OmpF porin, OOP family
MRYRTLSLAVALLAAPIAVQAQPFHGIYIGAGAGYNLPIDIGATTDLVLPSASTDLKTTGGFVGLASVGYALGNGMRFEIEGNYRRGNVNGATGPFVTDATGRLQTYAVMANALFDMDVGVPWLYPYIGLSLTTEYRFFGVPRDETFEIAAGNEIKLRSQYNHSFLLGVRYAFNISPPTPLTLDTVGPAPVAARSYTVFFDWDKATLTDRARQIIREAADNSTKVQYTRIEVNGYADTSGTKQSNQGLSVRRARAVQAELVKDGVPQKAITIQGFGDRNLLVTTGPGVREPQNRRVEIIIR